MVHAVDARGVALSLFFGLVFAGGHLNQEVRDYEFDRANGDQDQRGGVRVPASVSRELLRCSRPRICSSPVWPRLGVLPKILLLSVVAWLLHARWSLQALRRGLGFETAAWMQRRYRLLFALIGLAMLVR